MANPQDDTKYILEARKYLSLHPVPVFECRIPEHRLPKRFQGKGLEECREQGEDPKTFTKYQYLYRVWRRRQMHLASTVFMCPRPPPAFRSGLKLAPPLMVVLRRPKRPRKRKCQESVFKV